MKPILITLLLVALTTGCLKDIRPDRIEGATEPNAEMKGRALLDRAAKTQGVENFRRHPTYQMVIHDEWKGFVARAGNPWPQSEVDVRLSYRTNSFDGRAEFLSGKKSGATWGLQAWRTYEIEPGGDATFKKNNDAKFIIPAIQYLTEFVFRDHRDKVVSYAGATVIDGSTYERVYVTWGSMEPSKQHDQYVAYIDQKTGMLSKLEYTIREFASFVQGTVHYDDFREIDGVLLPMTQSITGKPTHSPDKYLHRISVKEFTFGVPSVESFCVDGSLAPVGDRKLAQK